jgi:hypothetical protein
LWKPIAVLLTIGIAVTLLLRQARDRPHFEEAGAGDAVALTAEASFTPEASSTPFAAMAADAVLPAGDAVSPTPTSSAVPPAEATPLGAHELTIAATEDAWLALAIDDQPSKQYLLRAGESRTWTGTRFSLTVGNAGGVSLSFDGRDLAPIGKPGQVVRNLRFPDAAPTPSASPD